MGLFNAIFGTKKIIESSIKLIDDAFYTNEEKAEQKRLTLKGYEPFKLAQRLLSLLFVSVFLILVVINIITSFFIDVSDQVTMLDEYLTLPVTLIVGFYFGGGAVEGIISNSKKNK